MKKNKLKIEDLFSDAQSVNEEVVVKVLQPLITIHTDTKDVYFKNHQKLTVEDKILVYALAKKILKFKGHIEKEIFSANEFHRKTGIKKGSVDPVVKKLREEGFLVGSGADYEVPNYRVDEVIKKLSKKSEE